MLHFFFGQETLSISLSSHMSPFFFFLLSTSLFSKNCLRVRELRSVASKMKRRKYLICDSQLDDVSNFHWLYGYSVVPNLYAQYYIVFFLPGKIIGQKSIPVKLLACRAHQFKGGSTRLNNQEVNASNILLGWGFELCTISLNLGCYSTEIPPLPPEYHIVKSDKLGFTL